MCMLLSSLSITVYTPFSYNYMLPFPSVTQQPYRVTLHSIWCFTICLPSRLKEKSLVDDYTNILAFQFWSALWLSSFQKFNILHFPGNAAAFYSHSISSSLPITPLRTQAMNKISTAIPVPRFVLYFSPCVPLVPEHFHNFHPPSSSGPF